MTNLLSVLEPYTSENLLGPSRIPPKAVDPAGLAGSLKELRAGNEKYFLLVVTMLVVVFAASMALLFVFARSPEALAMVLGASGVTTGFAVRGMMWLWKQKVMIEMLMALIPDLDAGPRQDVIDMIANYLRQGPPAPKPSPQAGSNHTPRAPKPADAKAKSVKAKK
jgi:hypothetical protein